MESLSLGTSSESSESFTVSSTRCSVLLRLRSLILGCLRSPAGARRFGDRVDEFSLGHGGSFLDPDRGCELDQLGLGVGLETAVRGIALQLARDVLCGRL